jgi:transcriptional regulator with XRE-family HTH domain
MAVAEISEFGRRLRWLRERAGFSQAELARRSGVARPSIVRAECGLREGLHAASLFKVARALGISIDRLIGDVYEELESDGKTA